MGGNGVNKQLYLTNVTEEEAWARWVACLPADLFAVRQELLDVAAALGRVLAQPVFAVRSSPHFLASAMDGIAVSAVATSNAELRNPLRLKIGGTAWWVDTGDPLPAGCDAVIMVEDLHVIDELTVEVIEPAVAWQHVRGIGEDIVQGDLLLPRHHILRPEDLASLLASGHQTIAVIKRPLVAIIPTGDELVPAGLPLAPGQITESNSQLFAGQVIGWGGYPVIHDIVPDEPHLLEQAVSQAAHNADIVVLNAGSSHGRDDYTVDVCSRLGRVAVHGILIRPGKPAVLAEVLGKPVIGVPGYPVSAALVMDLFVKPVMSRMLHQPLPESSKQICTLTRRVVSSIGTKEYVRVQVGRVGDKWVATPLGRGAGVLSSLVKSDGVLSIPEASEGYAEATEVVVDMREPAERLAQRVVCIGSHDLALDLLADVVRQDYDSFRFSSTHVGSLGGLMALKRGEAHMAGTHLFDPVEQEYNVSYLRRLFPAGGVVLINLVQRQQGLMLRKEDVGRVSSLKELISLGMRFINRQRGSGTRILLDYLLEKQGLSSAGLSGYEREETSHLNIAAAVSSDAADVGLGIQAAATAFGLAFVPLALERYDLAIERSNLQHAGIRRLLAAIDTPGFRSMVAELGGYDTSLSGVMVFGEE